MTDAIGYALNELVRLHAELGGKIKDNEKEAMKLRQDMMHVEAVLQILRPGFNTHKIAARRRNAWQVLFKRGEALPRALAVLREKGEPMTVRQIALELTARLGIEKPSQYHYNIAWSLVNNALRAHPDAVKPIVANPTKWEAVAQYVAPKDRRFQGR